MNNSTVIVLTLCGGAVIFAHYYFSKVREVTVPPKYTNIKRGLSLGKIIGGFL